MIFEYFAKILGLELVGNGVAYALTFVLFYSASLLGPNVRAASLAGVIPQLRVEDGVALLPFQHGSRQVAGLPVTARSR